MLMVANPVAKSTSEVTAVLDPVPIVQAFAITNAHVEISTYGSVRAHAITVPTAPASVDVQGPQGLVVIGDACTAIAADVTLSGHPPVVFDVASTAPTAGSWGAGTVISGSMGSGWPQAFCRFGECVPCAVCLLEGEGGVHVPLLAHLVRHCRLIPQLTRGGCHPHDKRRLQWQARVVVCGAP